MITLETEVPDPDVLLAMAPEDLAPIILRIAETRLQNGIFTPDNLLSGSTSMGLQLDYGGLRKREVELAVEEAVQWLLHNLMLVPVGGANRSGGWLRLGRRGQEMLKAGNFDSFKAAASFPKRLLHPSIADKVWLSLARGDFAEAVFVAFRAVEEAVRAAGKFEATDVGVALMRSAFQPKKGPLCDATQPVPEQEALMHLFAGAIGSYKNPHSHRTVTLNDASEAQEMVALASHLLRIVDARRNR